SSDIAIKPLSKIETRKTPNQRLATEPNDRNYHNTKSNLVFSNIRVLSPKQSATQQEPSVSYELDVVSLITKLYDQLSDAERKIATLILEDLNFAAHASISELAQKSNVSEATITRFARSMNCKNVRDLKLRLAQSLAVGQRFITDVKTEPGGIHSIYETIKSALD